MDHRKADMPLERCKSRSISFKPRVWNRLKQIEHETGARPSAVVCRILEREFGFDAESMAQRPTG